MWGVGKGCDDHVGSDLVGSDLVGLWDRLLWDYGIGSCGIVGSALVGLWDRLLRDCGIGSCGIVGSAPHSSHVQSARRGCSPQPQSAERRSTARGSQASLPLPSYPLATGA